VTLLDRLVPAFAALSARDRRALLVGTAVLLPALAGALVVKPYLAALTEVRETLAAQRELLGRERGLLTPAAGASAAESAVLSVARTERLFAGDDELAATANLARYVAGLAEAEGLAVDALETAEGEPAGAGLHVLRVELRATGDIATILEFLAALEAGDRLARVRTLALERRDGLTLSASVVGWASLGPEAPGATGGVDDL